MFISSNLLGDPVTDRAAALESDNDGRGGLVDGNVAMGICIVAAARSQGLEQ